AIFSFCSSFTSLPPPQSSPAPSNTPRPIPPARVRTLRTPHRESPAHCASHPQNSAPRTHTLPRFPTILRNSATSASRLPLPSRAPQNSHTQTPPAALLAVNSAGRRQLLQELRLLLNSFLPRCSQ